MTVKAAIFVSYAVPRWSQILHKSIARRQRYLVAAGNRGEKVAQIGHSGFQGLGKPLRDKGLGGLNEHGGEGGFENPISTKSLP